MPAFSGSRILQRRLPTIVVMTATCGVLAGCSQMSNPLVSTSKPALVIDASDTCATVREDFARSKSYFTDQILTGVGVGAGIGALLGAGIGAVTGTNVAVATAIGAGAGAAVGGVASYANLVGENTKNKEEMAQTVNADLVKEGDEIDRTTITFARLRQCRFQQATVIKADVRARRMNRATALTELSYQKARFDEELRLAQEYGLSMAKRGDQFATAAAQIRQDTAPPPNAGAVSMAATVSIPEKRASFEKSVKDAEKNSAVAFNLDTNARFSLRLLPIPHV